MDRSTTKVTSFEHGQAFPQAVRAHSSCFRELICCLSGAVKII